MSAQGYIDLYLLPVLEQSLDPYREQATAFGVVTLEHGAFELPRVPRGRPRRGLDGARWPLPGGRRRGVHVARASRRGHGQGHGRSAGGVDDGGRAARRHVADAVRRLRRRSCSRSGSPDIPPTRRWTLRPFGGRRSVAWLRCLGARGSRCRSHAARPHGHRRAGARRGVRHRDAVGRRRSSASATPAASCRPGRSRSAACWSLPWRSVSSSRSAATRCRRAPTCRGSSSAAPCGWAPTTSCSTPPSSASTPARPRCSSTSAPSSSRCWPACCCTSRCTARCSPGARSRSPARSSSAPQRPIAATTRAGVPPSASPRRSPTPAASSPRSRCWNGRRASRSPSSPAWSASSSRCRSRRPSWTRRATRPRRRSPGRCTSGSCRPRSGSARGRTRCAARRPVAWATTYLVPPIAIVLAWALLDETPPLLALAGGALCLLGVALARGARLPVVRRRLPR